MNQFDIEPEKPFKTVKGEFGFFIAMPSQLEIYKYQKVLHERFAAVVEELCKENNFGVTLLNTYMDVQK